MKTQHFQTVDYLRKTKPVIFSSLSTEDNEVVEFEDGRVENNFIQGFLISVDLWQRTAVGLHFCSNSLIRISALRVVKGISNFKRLQRKYDLKGSLYVSRTTFRGKCMNASLPQSKHEKKTPP